jgi:hypothetical protein
VTVEITFTNGHGVEYLINVLTEYIARHTFVKSIDGIVEQSGISIEATCKEKAYSMCVNMVENFIHSADFLLNWSLKRFFQNNNVLNITIYEKLNLKALREDFDAILRQPHALNYIFDSIERVMAAESSDDKEFFLNGLIVKSKVEGKPIFAFKKNEPLCIWIENGKITFGSDKKVFGIKDVICKELYEQGFNPQRDMTSVKVIALAVLFAGSENIIIYNGLHNKGIQEYLEKHKGVLGELNIFLCNETAPMFRKGGRKV